MITHEADQLHFVKDSMMRPRADTAMGAPSPYNLNNSKMKTMSGKFSNEGPANPFLHKSMNAIVPSSSFTTKYVGYGKGGGHGDQMSMKRSAARSFRAKQRKAEAIVLEHKKDLLEVRNLLNER